MKHANDDDNRKPTDPLNGVGLAEVWLALERIVRKGVRSLHFLPNHGVREQQQGEIRHHGDCRDKNPGWRMRQCEGGVEWKTHRESAVPIRMC